MLFYKLKFNTGKSMHTKYIKYYGTRNIESFVKSYSDNRGWTLQSINLVKSKTIKNRIHSFFATVWIPLDI